MDMRILIALAVGINTVVVGVGGYIYGRQSVKNEMINSDYEELIHYFVSAIEEDEREEDEE